MKHYLKLDLDTNKRHFVFGDIHGRMVGLERLFDKIKYDPSTDVLYGVGDLIDRGNYSVECIQFFTGNNVYSAMGNHEYMVMNPKYRNTWLYNGGLETIQSLNQNNRDENWLKIIIEEMPFVLDVGDGEHAFRIIHAELPRDWDSYILMEQLDKIDSDELSSKLQWGRTIMTGYKGVQHFSTMQIKFVKDIIKRNGVFTFSGHTPIKEPLILGNQAFLDTGDCLSCMNALTKEVFTVTAPYNEKY